MTQDKSQPEAVPAGHVPVDFPREVPLHSVMHIVGHLRGTEQLGIPELLQHAGVILGCTGAMMIPGPPEGGTLATSAPQALSNEALADELENGFKAAAAPQGAEAAAIPPWLIPILFEAAMRIFNEWLNRK